MAELTGVPYDDVRWQEISGQPFGVGVGYNGFLFGDLENIVDMEGPVAIAGNVRSYRGMSDGFGRMGKQTLPSSAKAVRFLAGGNVSISGALTVTGNVLTAGNVFQAGSGSTYLIGKDGSENQRQVLAQLYAANGSPYWEPADQGGNYVISSYDVPRRIPAARANVNVPAFFAAARASFNQWKAIFAAMTVNGQTRQGDYGYIMTGIDTKQNVFDLTWPTEGSIVGNLVLDVPIGSVSIVRIYGGDSMNISTPLWGNAASSPQTLYVLMNAKNVHLEFPTAIYGSIFAPDAQWNSATTGGNINGNAVLSGLSVQEGSGFELHWFPFAGGIISRTGETTNGTECPICPPLVACPEPTACPECPPAIECPICPTCLACPPVLECPAYPVCPEPTACPSCPVCPELTACPSCPVCPEPTACPICPECFISMGIIAGCITSCGQCQWRVKLCQANSRQVLSVWQACGAGCFSFEVDEEGNYSLEVETCCHYELTLKNIGVRSLSLRK